MSDHGRAVHAEDLGELSANPTGLSGSFGFFGLFGYFGFVFL